MGLPETVERKPDVFEHSSYAGISLEQIEAVEQWSEFCIYMTASKQVAEVQERMDQGEKLDRILTSFQDIKALSFEMLKAKVKQNSVLNIEIISAVVDQPKGITWDVILAARDIALGKVTRPLTAQSHF